MGSGRNGGCSLAERRGWSCRKVLQYRGKRSQELVECRVSPISFRFRLLFGIRELKQPQQPQQFFLSKTTALLMRRFIKDVNIRRWLSFLCLNLDKFSQEFNSKKNRLYLTNWAPNWRDEVWKDVNYFFIDVFTAVVIVVTLSPYSQVACVRACIAICPKNIGA